MDIKRSLRTSACAWLVTLLVALAPGAARAGFFDPFYHSDFSFPGTLASWSITAGSWQVSNGEFRSSSRIPLSIATVPTYGDAPAWDSIGGDLSLDVYLAIGSNAAEARAGAVFEFTDANNFHEVTLSAAGNVQLRSRIAGAARVVATATTTAPGANKWVHLTLVRATGRTTVRIDGVRVFDNVLQDGREAGDIGLLARNTSARFDDLEARSFGRQNDPYIEDFNDGVATLWQPLSGTWSAASKVYTNSAVIQTAITRGPLTGLWDLDIARFSVPHTLQVRMLNPYGGSGNLIGVAWVRDARNYQEAVFSPTGEARLNEIVNGVSTTIAAAQYAGAGQNRWFEVEIEHDGNIPEDLAVSRIKVNGVTVFDTAPPMPGVGEFSFITHWAPGRFDDVRAAPRFFRSFSEAFDDPLARHFIPGGWRLADSMLTSSTVVASDRAFVDTPYDWHELADIELRARMINRFANAGNLVGFTYGGRASVYYEALFSPTGVAHLRKVVKGVPLTIATAPYAGGGQNQWFDAQLIQVGERTTVQVNGVAVFENVSQPDALGGRLGFVTHWTNASIDDVLYAQIPATRYRVTALQNLANPFGPFSAVNALNDRGEAVGRSRASSGSQTAVLWRGGSVIALGAGNGTDAAGINDKSEIVGVNFGPQSFLQGFFWKNGVLTGLGASPDTTLPISAASDINERGQIAGASCNERGCPALMWEPDRTIVLLEDIPGGIVWGEAFAINEAGEVVGHSVNADSGFAAASWQGGVVEPLATGRGSAALDINNRGDIVGYAQLLFQRGVIWLDHEMFPLPVLPVLPESQARAINEHGVVVGHNTRPATSIDDAHAVIWQEGNVTDLNDRIACGTLPASILLTRAADINERGQIAVNAVDKNADVSSSQRAFILTPVSAQEPCN